MESACSEISSENSIEVRRQKLRLREFTLSAFKPETELSEPAGERLKSNLLKSQSDRKQVAFNFKPDLKKKRAASLTQDFFKRFRKAWIRRDLLLEKVKTHSMSLDRLHQLREAKDKDRAVRKEHKIFLGERESVLMETAPYFKAQMKQINETHGYKMLFYARPVGLKKRFKASTYQKFRIKHINN